MLTFYADLDGTGTYFTRVFEIQYGTTPKVGFSFPGYLVGPKRNVLLERRSSLDYLKTGKAKFARDHDCDNLQVTADIAVPITLVGPYLRDYDVRYGLIGSRWHQPPTPVGYNISDVMSSFGSVYDATKRWEYRESPCPVMDADNPAVPLVFGRSYVRSYSAVMSNSPSYRYTLMSNVGVVYSVPSAIVEKPLYVFHMVSYARSYASDGTLSRTVLNAITYVLASGPRAEGETTPETLFLRPMDMAWVTSQTAYTNPTILSSLSTKTVVDILMNPSKLFGATGIDPLLSTKLLRWGAVNLYKRLTASCDADRATLFAYNNAVTTYLWQRIYARKGPSVPPDWNELGDTAADNINQVSINTLAYMRDLKTILDTLRATIALAGNPSSPKAWTSWWLSMRYGDRLTYRDTIELSQAVSSNIVSRYRRWSKDYYTAQARDSTIEYSKEDNSSLETQRFIKLYYKPKWDDWVSKAIVASLKWDIWPTLGNSWDLIPFSFVVDWFVDVQGILESIDRRNLLLMHRVLSVIMTDKKIYTFDDTALGDLQVTNCKAIAYSRRIVSSLPTSPFRMDRGHLAAINIIDGISLIFQA